MFIFGHFSDFTVSFDIKIVLVLFQALFEGLLLGLLMGLFFGIAACIQHYVLRFWLWHNHIFPWKAVPFLEDATVRVLLRRAGGGYSFTHRLLLDYFANWNAITSSPSMITSVLSATLDKAFLFVQVMSTDGKYFQIKCKTLKAQNVYSGPKRILSYHYTLRSLYVNICTNNTSRIEGC